jgi:hypothetical protein
LLKNWMVLNVTAAVLQTIVSKARITCARALLGINLYPPLERLSPNFCGAVKMKARPIVATATAAIAPGLSNNLTR